MTSNGADDSHKRLDRRTLLRHGALVTGGIALGSAGIVAADKPDKYEIDLTGQELGPVPCLGEKVEIKQGTWAITEDSQSSQGKCWHYQFHFHYTDRLKVEGIDTGRVWTGQGSKNESLNVCPPFPAEQTVTNSTTITSKDADEDKVVQFKFTGHVTINANGDWTASFVDGEFRCQA